VCEVLEEGVEGVFFEVVYEVVVEVTGPAEFYDFVDAALVDEVGEREFEGRGDLREGLLEGGFVHVG